MAEGKYGRLFTEADVKRIVAEAVRGGRANEGRMWSDITEEAIGRADVTFPADEPLFLLRAQDLDAPSGVEGYLHARDLRQNLSDEPLTEEQAEFSNAVHAALVEMREWQQRERTRVKVAD